MICIISVFQCPTELYFSNSAFEYGGVNDDLYYQCDSVWNIIFYISAYYSEIEVDQFTVFISASYSEIEGDQFAVYFLILFCIFSQIWSTTGVI